MIELQRAEAIRVLSKDYTLAPLAGECQRCTEAGHGGQSQREKAVIEDCYVISSLRKFRRKLRVFGRCQRVVFRGMNAPLTTA